VSAFVLMTMFQLVFSNTAVSPERLPADKNTFDFIGYND